jgi:hypothetical protein
VSLTPTERRMIADLVRRLTAQEAQVRRLARKPQLPNSSVDDGAIGITGGDVDRGQLGLQHDGTYTLSSVNGPKPPAPDAPDVEGNAGFLLVSWDGNFVGDDGIQDPEIPAPMDWNRCAIHVGSDEDFVVELGPESETRVASIEDAGGAEVPLLLPSGDWWVKLVTGTQSGVFSDPSEAAPGTVSDVTSSEDLTALEEAQENLQGAVDDHEVDISDLADSDQQISSDLDAYKDTTDQTLTGLQDGYDALTGLGDAGVEEDYFFVGDDPDMATIKLVQISQFVQDALGAGDGQSLADALDLAAKGDLGDVEFNDTDPPMTTFYAQFELAGIPPMPYNAGG